MIQANGVERMKGLKQGAICKQIISPAASSKQGEPQQIAKSGCYIQLLSKNRYMKEAWNIK